MVAHASLTGSDLHEPKGAASASSGQVYVANGSGSGVWTTPATSYITLCVTFKDISTAGTQYVASPAAGTIKKIYLTLQGAITGADSSVTFAIGGTSIDSSTITAAQSGSTAGTTFSSTPSGHNTVSSGSVVSVASDGGSTNTVDAQVVILIQVT